MKLTNSQDRLKEILLAEKEHCLLSAELGRRRLKEFVKMSWSTVEPAPFCDGYVIDCICEHLEAVTFGQILRLLINIPPRHSKSTIISVIWPVWSWLHAPHDKFLQASYSLDLSTRDNRRKRVLIESLWFQQRYGSNFRLATDQNVKRFFENDHQGYQMAVSVNGATTGHGGSRLVLDDPHSAAEAHSAAERSAALRWFREVWSNRLNNANTDAMVTVGQRVHEDDVSGYIIKERPDWIKVILPALYEPGRHCSTPVWTDWRSEENELLWPERFSRGTLDGLRRDLGSLGFAAQYQQSPVLNGGEQFKARWFRYYTREGDELTLFSADERKAIFRSKCRVIITVDLAISLKQSADFSVFAVWGITPDKDLLLLNRIRDRLDNPTQQKLIMQLHRQHEAEAIYIESTAYQLSIIQQLSRHGLPVREYKPTRDKVSRASTAAIYYENGKVYHPLDAPWLAEFEDELLKFPMTSHDDQVDCTSMACEQLAADEHAKATYYPNFWT